MAISLGTLLVIDGTDVTVSGTNNALDVGNATIVRLTGLSTPTVNGIAGGTSGRVLFLVQVSGTSVSLVDESGSATATDRLDLATTPYTLTANGCVCLVYGNSRWRLVGKSE